MELVYSLYEKAAGVLHVRFIYKAFTEKHRLCLIPMLI